MSLFPTVAKNTLTQITGRSAVVLISITTTAFLARFLGVTGYGNYVFILAFVLFFVAIADWGTGLIFVREVVKNKKQEGNFYGHAFLFRLLLAIIVLFAVNFLVFFVPLLAPLSLPLKIASFLLLLISLKTSCHIVFQAKLKFEYIAITDIATSLVFLLVLLFVFLFLGVAASLQAVIFFFLLANVLGTMLALYLAWRMTKLDFGLHRPVLRRIVFEALPTGALLLIFSIYNRLDIFLLQWLKGAEPVGIYGLAYKVHDNLILGAVYLVASLFPAVSVLANKSRDKGKLAVIYRKTFDLLALAGLVVLIGVFLAAPAIVFIVGGQDFASSVLVLRILVFATMFSYFNHLTGYTLIALGKQRVSLLVAAIALVWNLGLNLIFIPRYSYLAAAGVTVATEGLVLFLTSFYLAKNFGLHPSFTFPRTFVELIKTRGKIF